MIIGRKASVATENTTIPSAIGGSATCRVAEGPYCWIAARLSNALQSERHSDLCESMRLGRAEVAPAPGHNRGSNHRNGQSAMSPGRQRIRLAQSMWDIPLRADFEVASEHGSMSNLDAKMVSSRVKRTRRNFSPERSAAWRTRGA